MSFFWWIWLRNWPLKVWKNKHQQSQLVFGNESKQKQSVSREKTNSRNFSSKLHLSRDSSAFFQRSRELKNILACSILWICEKQTSLLAVLIPFAVFTRKKSQNSCKWNWWRWRRSNLLNEWPHVNLKCVLQLSYDQENQIFSCFYVETKSTYEDDRTGLNLDSRQIWFEVIVIIQVFWRNFWGRWKFQIAFTKTQAVPKCFSEYQSENTAFLKVWLDAQRKKRSWPSG